MPTSEQLEKARGLLMATLVGMRDGTKRPFPHPDWGTHVLVDRESADVLLAATEAGGVCECGTGAHIAEIRTDMAYCYDCGKKVPRGDE